jgi:two-component system, OmpR family, sensor kinase
MKRFTKALAGSVVVAALGGALVTFAIMTVVAIVGMENTRHATLDAASAAVRASVATENAATVGRWLNSMQDTFSAWDVDVAAFDSDGTFVAGDVAMRGDGLPVGREPPPPAARQVAIVPMQGGYVLLMTSSRSIVRLRFVMAFWFVVIAVVVGAIAYVIGSAWARQRSRSVALLDAHLGAMTRGERPNALAVDDDPLFGDLSNAARAALDRLVRELDSRAAGEDRLRSFLAEAGHELRTPLAIAVGYIGILKRGAIDNPELAERIVGDISAEHDRLHRLVERILQLARLDAVPGDSGAVSDVVAIVDESIALVRPLDPTRRFNVDAPAKAEAAIGSDDLRDAVRNLLENSIRYAPNAPVTIRVALDGDVSIRISDEGPGMDAFTVEHAFDRFFRGNLRGEIPGSGLGLAIVRRIVERAGGSVALQSAPGTGTAVEVRVPRATPS